MTENEADNEPDIEENNELDIEEKNNELNNHDIITDNEKGKSDRVLDDEPNESVDNEVFECSICGKESDNQKSISMHSLRSHRDKRAWKTGETKETKDKKEGKQGTPPGVLEERSRREGKNPSNAPIARERDHSRHWKDHISSLTTAVFCAKKLADEIQENYSFVTHRVTEEIYVYEKGVYSPNGESIIREYARKRLDDKSRRSYVNEVVEHIRETKYMDADEFNKHKKHIHCKNSIFNIQKILDLR